MIPLLLVVGICSAVSPGLLGGRFLLLAADRARLATWALGLGLVAWLVGLVGLGAPPLLRAMGAVRLAHLCTVGQAPLSGALLEVLGWASLAWLAAAGVATARVMTRHHHDRRSGSIEDTLGTHQPLDNETELVVLPTAQLAAWSVGSPRRQVIVTSGLIEGLNPLERAVVIDHERAHLRFRHERLLTIAALAEAAFLLLPQVHRSASVLRINLECWADEESTGSSRRRRTAARRALLHVVAPDLVGVVAFGGAEGVAHRLCALEGEPTAGARSHRMLSFTAMAGTTTLSAVAFLGTLASASLPVAACPH